MAAPTHEDATHYTDIEIVVGEDTVGSASADLWKATDARGEWGGLLRADFNAVEKLGIDLTIRMSDGQTGHFLVEEIIDKTHVTIHGTGPAPF